MVYHNLAKGLPRISCAEAELDRVSFNSQLIRIAGGLKELGIGAGACVALIMGNGIDFVTITMATGRLGAYAVPINWHLTPHEVDMILADCEPAIIFIDDAHIASLPPHWKEKATVIRVPDGAPQDSSCDQTLAFNNWFATSPNDVHPPRVSPGSIVYTSGTTGQPKGVKRAAATTEQAQAMQEIRALLFRLTPEDRVLVPGPLYHAFPNQLAAHAVPLVAYVEIMRRFDAEELLRIIERERITSVGLAPIMFVRLLRLPDKVRSAYDISSLRWAIHAGGPCAPDIKHAMIDWWGPIISEYYGGTETGPLTLCTGTEWLARPGSVGKPINGARIRIVDGTGADLPPGKPGEVFGRLDPYPDFTYHNDPGKRAEVGLGDLVSLGDVGYQDEEGYLYLCDRARDMIVSGGVNIYPVEVENALFSVPGVEDCAVFGIPDAEFGEAVIAYVAGNGLEGSILRQNLRQDLAGYKVPRDIVIVPSLLRDASGKLRKRNLRDDYLAGKAILGTTQH